MGDFLHEFRFALRQLHRRPLYASIVVLTLAVGIGATSAVLSVANPVLFRPLPYPDAERIVKLGDIEQSGSFSDRLGFLTFRDIRRNVQSLESAAAISEWGPVLFSESGSERLTGQSVSAGFFSLLGVPLLLGREFRAEEDQYGQNRVVILSHGLWRRRYGSDPAIMGRRIQLGSLEYEVAGVLPPGFESLLNPAAQIWRPLGYNDTLEWACRTCQHLGVVARLKADVPLGQAQAELATEADRLRRDFPTQYAMSGLRAVRLRDHLVKDVRPALLLMLGAGLFVLAIACANVGNLILARTTEREGELQLRTSLGAAPGRLLHQLMTETLVLCLAGAGAGLVLARLGLAGLLRLAPDDLPRLDAIALDWRIVAMALGATLGVALLTGVIPGLYVLRRSMTPVAARSVTTGRRQRQVTAALVVAEISLAFMLLSGAGLLTRSLGRVLAVDPGFETANLLTLSVTASGSRYQTDSAVWRMQSVLLQTLETNPGVLSAAMASQIPLGGNLDQYGVVIEDQPPANPEDVPSADRYAVSPGYVAAMRIPVRRGRDFTPEDRGGAVPVALINETFARLSWPGSDPIGKRIRLGGEQRPWRTIVGIVGDVQHVGLDSRPAPQVYVPAEQWMWAENGFDVVLRTHTPPAQLAPQVRASIAAVDPGLAIQDVAGAEDLVAATTADRRLIVRLFEAFAAIALLLAAAGIYGLLSRRVAERQRELGIRAALGATRQAILEHVLRDGGRLAGLGVIIGVGGALGVSRLIESLLFGVAPRDPVTLTAAGGLLAAVALIACLLPALRAARVDPVEVLRNE
jgi:putative ABC transport system permease protein